MAKTNRNIKEEVEKYMHLPYTIKFFQEDYGNYFRLKQHIYQIMVY